MTTRVAILATLLALAGATTAPAQGFAVQIGTDGAIVPPPGAPRDPFDFDPDEPAADPNNGMMGMVNQFEMNEAQINGWIFQDGQDASGARKKMEEQLVARLSGLADLCRLEPAQEAKLRLAGTGDVERFFDKVDALRRQHANKKYDQNQIGEVYQKFQPISQEYQNGLFGDRSLLARAVRRTLEPEQAARYEALLAEQRAFQYHAKVGYTLDMLNRQLGLTDEQYGKIEALLVEQGPKIRALGRVEYYAILYQLSKVPEETLRPIVDDDQWKLLQAQVQQGRGMREMLLQQGYLEDDDATAEPDAKPATPGAADERVPAAEPEP